MSQLTKSKGPIFGVCGGIAKKLNADPTIIRVVTVVLGLIPFTSWAIFIGYIGLGIFMPKENNQLTPPPPSPGISPKKIYCKDCGFANEEKGKFCRSCGQPL